MQKIYPCLWFDHNAEEAVNFYLSIFPNSKILSTTHYGKEGFEIHQMEEGTVLTIDFELDGHRFLALNGGPVFKFTEAVSFVIDCKDQAEVDHYWEKLSAVPESEQCGWLKDKFGVSWQVTPTILNDMIADPNPEKAGRAMNAMMQMKKIVIADLQAAYDQK